LEHFIDELRRLDLLIRLRILREQPKKPGNLFEQFRGAVLSDEEITGPLDGPEPRHADDASTNPEYQAHEAIVTALSQLEGSIQQRLVASSKDGVYLSLPILAQLFHLSRFEEHCLIVALAPELDRKYQTLRSLSQPLQTWECMRASLETELALELVDAEVPIVPFPLQHTKRGQAAREMMPLRPFGTGLTAVQAQLILADPDDFLNVRAHVVQAAHLQCCQRQTIDGVVLLAVSDTSTFRPPFSQPHSAQYGCRR
jgi:hypothetical protein